MRFSLSPNDRRVMDLVAALDRDDISMAETWRLVCGVAPRLGLRSPGYHLVRRLARAERRERAARAAVREATVGLGSALLSPYVVHTLEALDRLREARAEERFVLQQHKPPRSR